MCSVKYLSEIYICDTHTHAVDHLTTKFFAMDSSILSWIPTVSDTASVRKFISSHLNRSQDKKQSKQVYRF